MSAPKKYALIGFAIVLAPFGFYGWLALVAKFLNIVFVWANR
jgi:hypothetical protein